jgi:hypothetical protein
LAIDLRCGELKQAPVHLAAGAGAFLSARERAKHPRAIHLLFVHNQPYQIRSNPPRELSFN